MKKIAFLLALILVFSVFAVACQDTTEVSDVSDVPSEGEISESPKNDFVLTGNPVSENPQSTIVTNGASYTKSVEAGEAYADTYGTELTDGIRSGILDGNYSDTTLSGYSSSVNVTVDLGTVYDTLYSFKVGYLNYNEAGISEPASITVQASIDGKKWTRVGSLAKVDPPEDDRNALLGTVQDANLEVKGYIRAQYVRFDIVSRSAWVFLDEVMAIADINGSEKDSKYVEAVNSAYQTLGSVQKPTSDVDINRELDKVLISKGASYIVDGTIKNFKDIENKMLTDGKTSGFYEGETWVGFDLSSDAKVTLDLGENVTDIASIEANFFTNTAIGVYMPVAVKIAALDEDKNRTELAVLYGNTVLSAGDFCFALPLDKAISARYIEFTFVATETNVAMVEELAVYAYRNDDGNTLYPEVILENSATEWGADSSDEYENLLLGRTQQIVAGSDVEGEAVANNTPVTSKLLTDGVRAVNTDIHNGRYFKFSHGGNRTVIYDLEHISAVDKFTASFVEKTDWAVQRPAKVMVMVSVDGTSWYNVSELVLKGQGSDFIYKGEIVLDKPMNIRYVSFNFDVGAWVGCDEIEVFGKKNSSGSSPEALGFEVNSGFFVGKRIEPSEELLGGAKDLCLMYHSTSHYYETEDFIPYLSYVDKDGKSQDVMFDSFLFLYANTTFPSGARPHENGNMSDWQWTIDDLYTEGRNVMALEEAAGQVKTALGLPEDYKFKYTVTLYYPSVGCAFGDVDGDGITENFSNYEDRKKAMQWYIDEIEKIDAASNFSNIELVGYYWWHEEIVSSDAESEQLLNDISDMVHATDKEFFWIPYYCSNGYSQWADYGFDVACMQPNYVFSAEADYSRVVNCAELTELYGMGFEMEIDGTSLSQELFYKKYMQYLGSGATLGYMNDTIVMYYQGNTIFADAAFAETAMARNVYDQTYHFIKGDLVYNPEAITALNYEAEKNTPFVGNVEYNNELPREFRIDSMPEHGTVLMNGDGSFTFYPEKDFTGEVKFSFAYNEYLGWSDSCEVTINVK